MLFITPTSFDICMCALTLYTAPCIYVYWKGMVGVLAFLCKTPFFRAEFHSSKSRFGGDGICAYLQQIGHVYTMWNTPYNILNIMELDFNCLEQTNLTHLSA